jgi:hypothetical protein
MTVAVGFAILVVGMAAGSTLSLTSSDAFIAGWTFVVGAGAGLAFATAASAAIGELSAERSGVGSALLQAVIKLGPAFGATILGSVVNATYQAQLHLAGLPADATAAVEKSVFAGLAVARQTGSAALLDSVRTAFIAGIDDSAKVATVIAIGAALLALAFLPSRSGTVVPAEVAHAELSA